MAEALSHLHSHTSSSPSPPLHFHLHLHPHLHFHLRLHPVAPSTMGADFIAFLFQRMQSSAVELALELPHSRMHEEEADEVGIMLAARACFDPRRAPHVWELFEEEKKSAKLAEKEAARKAGELGQLGRVNEDSAIDRTFQRWLMTHPLHADRVANLTALVPEAMDEWARGNCGEIKEAYLIHRKHSLQKHSSPAAAGVAAAASSAAATAAAPSAMAGWYYRNTTEISSRSA